MLRPGQWKTRALFGVVAFLGLVLLIDCFIPLKPYLNPSDDDEDDDEEEEGKPEGNRKEAALGGSGVKVVRRKADAKDVKEVAEAEGKTTRVKLTRPKVTNVDKKKNK